MPGAPSICEPIAAGVVVGLFNRYVLSGALWTWCCGSPAGDDPEDDSGDSYSSASVAEVGVVADADCHQGGHTHHVDATG